MLRMENPGAHLTENQQRILDMASEPDFFEWNLTPEQQVLSGGLLDLEEDDDDEEEFVDR